MHFKYSPDHLSKWSILLITSAILVKIFLDFSQSKHVYEPDVESAITRAKTIGCKRELEDFANRLLVESLDSPQILKRACKLDLDRQRIVKVGCLTNSTNGLIKLNDHLKNHTICLEHCFSYGHSHGGFDSATKECYCGDEKFIDESHQHNTKCIGHDEIEWYQVNVGVYYNQKRTVQSISNNENFNSINETTTRIAFLIITNGRSTSHIRRIIKNIYSKIHVYYIHVDNRDDYLYNNLSDLEKTNNNILLAKSRFNTIWGGPSLLRMMIDAMNNLSQYKWDYLINLSETDFPIKPLVELEKYLQANKRMIYLRSHNIKGYKFIRKQGLDRNFYQCEDRVWRIGKRQLPRGIIFSGGSDWYALPKDFCEYILSNLGNSHSLVKPLVQLYNFTLLPAESFFHTLALNSEFCDRFADNNLRITNWQRKQGCQCQHKNVVDWCGCSPLIYRWSDWEKLKQTNTFDSLFFSRKFDPTVSSSIIEAVEQQLVNKNLLLNEDNIIKNDVPYTQNIYSSNDTTLSPISKYLKQFGMFALRQSDEIKFSDDIDLVSVHSYFKEDRFKGLVYSYCDNSTCVQLLIEKNIHSHINNLDSICIQSSERQLKVIEVNHGFDTGERMFRNYVPLNSDSEIVVYHEWILNQTKNINMNNFTDRLLFSWFNPHGQLELMQNVKLKFSSKPTKLSLAHRLNLKEPLISGLWTLTISHHNRNCLSYNFLVFDDRTFIDNSIDQYQFNNFYSVSLNCVYNNTRFEKQQTIAINDIIENQEQNNNNISCKVF